MAVQKLNRSILEAAILGFESQKQKIDNQIAELRQMLNGSSTGPTAATEPTNRKRRTISAAGRQAIAEAQRKRWAASKGQSAAAAPKSAKPKRKLSNAGRAAIVAALKKRWAAKKAEAAKT